MQDKSVIYPSESRTFWVALFITPLFWLLFAITSILKLNFQWLVIVCVALALNTANIVGYIKCARGNSIFKIHDTNCFRNQKENQEHGHFLYQQSSHQFLLGSTSLTIVLIKSFYIKKQHILFNHFVQIVSNCQV